jgi:integrase
LPNKLLTTAAVAKLKPSAVRREVRDGGAPGLHLVIQPSGYKSWVVRFRGPNGRHVKLTLGPLDLTRSEKGDPVLGGPLTLAGARIVANQVTRQRSLGVDVARQKRDQQRTRASSGTFAALVEDFIADHARPKNRGWRDTAKVLGLLYPEDADQPTVVAGGLADRWASTPATEIDAHTLYDAVDEARRVAIPGMGARVSGTNDSRGRALAAALGKLFAWAAQHRRVPTNPALGMYRPALPPSRHRVLSPDEVRSFWQACDEVGWPFGPAFKLLLLTAQRRSEVTDMAWAELNPDLSVWSIPPARTKNKLPHVVPLPPLARTILSRCPRVAAAPHVFTVTGITPISGFSKIKGRLDSSMATGEEWRLHDLRRTAATGMAEIGIAPHVIEAILNHISGARASVAGIYNRAQYQSEKKQALEQWATYVERLVSADKKNVVQIKRRRR